MAVRSSFTAGEVLTAADLTDTFASKLDLAGGKILQIVRATDSTQRSTTSTSFVDVTGMSVTITPQKSDSAVLLLATGYVAIEAVGGSSAIAHVQITDSSNNAISGAEATRLGSDLPTGNTVWHSLFLMAYATPATTSAVTYKLRFRGFVGVSTILLQNAITTGQMYAIEVSA